MLYNVTAPLFESSDEMWHYRVVKYLADGRGLPEQPPPADYFWRQEGSQPPLYYLLAALASSWVDSGPAAALVWENPHARVGVPLAPDNKNMAIHTEREAFPYQGAPLAMHLVRLLTSLFGTAAVACTYLIARELYPDLPWLPPVAAAIHAFVPMYLFVSASVDNDALAVLAASLVLLLLVRSLRRGLELRRSLLLGAALGVAALAKLSALGLFPLALLALWLAGTRGKGKGGRGKGLALHVGLAFGLAAVIGGWWYGRNWVLYGDPTGLNAFLAQAGVRDPTPGLLELLGEWQGLRISFWGLFGGSNVLMSEPLYWLLDAASLAALGGLVIFLRRDLPQTDAATRWGTWLLLLWLAIVSASLYRWTQITLASLGRLLFPSLSAIAILMALGLGAWWPSRRAASPAAMGLALFLIATLAPFFFILPAYSGPHFTTEEEALRAGQPVHINFADRMELVSYALEQRSVRPGETVRLAAYWKALAPMGEDYSTYVHLLADGGAQASGQVDTYPGAGSYPTSLWRRGQVIRDQYEVLVTGDPRVATLLEVEVGAYLLEGFRGLTARDAAGQPVTPRIARLRLEPLTPAQPSVARNADRAFQGVLRLAGYAAPARVRPGDPLAVDILWEALAPMDRDYTVFLHLVGPERSEGRRGQVDVQPRGGRYPTGLWQPGELVQDQVTLRVEEAAPPGTYRLVLGLYDLATMEHLAPADDPTARSIALTQVEVAP